MAALIQFVDSISDDPTIRLDLNDGLSWFCQSFKAPPPRLRRSESENSMRDGGVVGSSSYSNRTLELDLTLIEEGDEEWAADEMQKLWRELDRPANFIRYWPEGLEKPVFFRTFRSDVSELEELWTVPIARNISLEVLAEPFALGLPETLGGYDIPNDPANPAGCHVDIDEEIMGDVPAPAVIQLDHESSTFAKVYMGVRNDSLSPDVLFVQAESMSPFVDTSNPGGGPDAAMSGTGSNNFQRTSFATSSMQIRLSATTNVSRGTYRLLAGIRRSDSTSAITVQAEVAVTGGTVGPAVATPLSTNRQLVDLGLFSFRLTNLRAAGYSSASTPASSPSTVFLKSSRASGTGTLDWDFLLYLPADVSTLVAQGPLGPPGLVIDGVAEATYPTASGGNPLLGTTLPAGKAWPTSGSFVYLVPNSSNRWTLLHSRAAGHFVGDQVSLRAYYWPRYLFVRPVSS